MKTTLLVPLLLPVALAAASATSATALPPKPGLVVEAVEPGYVSALSGVHVGDVWLAWREEDGQKREGVFTAPLAVSFVEADVLARGPVTVTARRGDRTLVLHLRAEAPGFGLELRPQFPPAVEDLYLRGLRLVNEGSIGAGTALWRRAADRLADAGGEAAAARCYVLGRVGRAWRSPDHVDDSRQAFAEAQECAEAFDLGWVATLVDWQGQQEMAGGRPDIAEDAFRVADGLAAERHPGTLIGLPYNLVGLVSRRGRLDEGLELARQLVDTYRREAPDSLVLASAYITLAWVHQLRTEPDEAAEAALEAAAIAERAGPDSRVWALSMTIMGGTVSTDNERYFRRAYEWQRRVAPESADTVRALLNMGAVTASNGDLASALEWFKRGLALAGRAPVSNSMRAMLIANLASTHLSLGDAKAALPLLRSALRLLETSAPGLYTVAETRIDIGDALAELGQPEAALEMYYAALDQCDVFAPGSHTEARALLALAEFSRSRGDAAVAAEAYERAAAILTVIMPTSPETAKARAGQARSARAAGRLADAEGHLREAVDIIESNREHVGGTDEARALFASQHYGIYQELVDLLAGQERSRDAFEVLEHGHARAQLALLAERRLTVAVDVSPEIEKERRRLDADYDRARGDLARLGSGGDGLRREPLLARLHDVRDRQEVLAGRIRELAPGMAAFRYPQPLGVDEAAARLDPGTLLLTYSVGRQRTIALALSVPAAGASPALACEALPVAEADLRRRVRTWRRGLERGAPDARMQREARALYDLLLRPFAARIAGARRVLIVPDGPLHGLPFAALHDGRRFVGQSVSLAFAPSATLAALWASSRPSGPWTAPVIFADPEPADGRLPLPGSRVEAAAIAGSFPGAALRLGRDASEEAAKALPQRPRFVHFAVHGAIDEASPLDSGLALRGGGSGEGAQNGLFQAWEIVERVRLDTDLVTLSACRSAAGPERAGEGTMGLVRAFQYAGAHSVLASLWSVNDLSTVAFMRRFYSGLARGDSKSEALRKAQAAAIREGVHPRRWASFQLYGDWK